ncbi:MAG: glycine betaine ABC transporter substrate-binding protein [Parabacteroides sp.]|nr:glycine betaine ABC transporter substrate-binding protein [Parabacteroides sp.]
MKKKQTILFIAWLMAMMTLASCGKLSDNKIRIAYANWAEGIAVTHLAKEILTEQGYRVELLNADIAPIFTSLARGKTDVFMDSWQPVTHADYFKKYNGKLEILGQVYDSARIGLVVPAYVPIRSIEELSRYTDKFKGEIVGIDAGTGIMKCTERAIPEYGLNYELMISSGPAMTALLDKAIRKGEWIVVTGWTPHWMFGRYDLKVLSDPKNIYGDSESIHTIARHGFSLAQPFVAELLGNVHLTDSQISSLMSAIAQTRGTEREAVKEWIRQNRALVDSWIPQTSK